MGFIRRRLKPICFECNLELVLQRIADRYRITGHACPSKFEVVVHEIKVRFRPQENVAGNVQTNAAAKMSQEVVAALEIGATREAAGDKWRVEAEALAADPRLKLGLHVLADRRSPDRVEIVKDRPVRREEDVHVLVGSPRDLAADAEIFLEEEKVSAERRITAAADALRRVAGAGIGSWRSGDRPVTESYVKLLSAGNVRDT